MLTLTALNGQDKGREFQLTGQQPELMGRQAPNIKLTDAQTSRRHAEILLENNTWLIRDLGSTNGTWVNGQKITHITELEVGDRVVMGRHQFRVSKITDVPAPSPKPRPMQPEPAIGQEDLGDMGIDLAESLSADMLDEDGSGVHDIPAEALDLQEEIHEAESPPAAAPDTSKAEPDSDDDGVIDLDALLAEPIAEPALDSPDLSDSQEPESLEPAEPDSTADEVTPEPSAEPSYADEPEDDGVIDLDAVLADEPAEASPEAPAPVEQASSTEPEPEEQERTAESLEPAEPESPADEITLEPSAEPSHADEPEDDGVIDLDAMLADEPAEASPEAPAPVEQASSTESEPNKPEHDFPATAEAEPDTPEQEPAAEDITLDAAPDAPESAPADEDVFDLDDMLGASKPAPAEALDSEAPDEEPQIPESSAQVEPDAPDEAATTEPPTAPLAADDEPFDVDAYLGLDSEDESQSASEPVADADAGADIQEPQNVAAATGEVAFSEDLDDILGDLPDRSDSVDTSQEQVEPEQPDEAPSEHEPEPEPDNLVDIDVLADAKPTDNWTAADSGVDASADSAVLDDTDGSAVGVSAPVQDDIAPPDQDFLMSPDEQARAVSGYKRSKLLRTAVIVCLFLGVLAVAGWFGYSYYFANRADTHSTPSRPGPTPADNQPAPEPSTDPISHSTESDTSLAHEPASMTDDTATAVVQSTVDQPETAEPVAEHTARTTRPTPDQMAPPLPIQSPARGTADPFADINTKLTAPEPTATAIAPEPETTDTPDASHDASHDPLSPDPTARAQTPSPPAPATDKPDDTTGQAEISPTPLLPTPGESPADEPSAIDVLTEAIEAQHEPGGDVTAQAILAGAPRIAYIVDASGSLVDNFPQVLNELHLEVAGLADDQAFTVIFFGSDGITEVPPAGLRWADGRNKRLVREWTHPDRGNVIAWGRGDPIKALQRAVEYNPTEVVILSDNLIGRQASQDDVQELLARFEQVLGDDVRKVNVIQFFNRDPLQALKSIAERFNGSYSLILARPSPDAQSAVEDPLIGN